MSKDVAKARVRFDTQPKTVGEGLIPVCFDTNEGPQTVYTLLENGEELTEDRINRASQTTSTYLWLINSNMYDWLSKFIYEKQYPHAPQLLLNSLCINLAHLIASRYAEQMQEELSKLENAEQLKRIRHYQLNLIQYNLEKNERIINIDGQAFSTLVHKLVRDYSDKEIFHDMCMRLYLWASKDVLSTPEKNSEYYDELRHYLNNDPSPTDEDIESDNHLYEKLLYIRILFQGGQLNQEGVLKLAEESAMNILSLHHAKNNLFSLRQLEKEFGLVIGHNPGPNDIPIPTGDGPTAITEGLNAAANKSWICNEYGELFYQTAPLSDGLVVKLTLSQNIKKPQTVMKRLKRQLLADIDPLTVRLNTLLCSIAEIQPNAWHEAFTVDTRELAKKINMGRQGRVSQAKQSEEILRRVRALSQIKVLIYWTDEDKELTRETSNLWILTDRAKWKSGQDELSADPYRYELELKPGNWVNHCLATENNHRDLHGTAYIPEESLKKKNTLISSMRFWYDQTQRTQFTVSEWMTGIHGHVKLNLKLQDRKSKSQLKKDVCKTIKYLKDKVEPSFKIIESDNWLTSEIVKQIQIGQPIPLSNIANQIKQLRHRQGLSQKDLGGIVGYSQSRISQVERDPAANSDAAERLLEHLKRRASPE